MFIGSGIGTVAQAVGLLFGNGGPGGRYWAIPTLPTPSGTIVYATNDTEFTNALTTLATSGGTIALDPAGSYASRTISSNPSAVIWITTGTSGGGLVSQSLPAINYAQNTRATIAKLTYGAGITNIKLHTLNIGSTTNHGDGTNAVNANLYSSEATNSTSFPDLYAYNCELFGRPMEPNGWSMRIRVASNASFNVNDNIVGATSGTTATVVAKDGSNGLLVKNVLAGGTTDISITASWTDFIGPFTDGETLNVGGSGVSTYSAPYLRITVSTTTGFSVGNTVTGKTSSYSGVIAEIDGTNKYLYLKTLSAKPVITSGVVGGTFTNSEGLSITGAGGTQIATYTASTATKDSRHVQSPTTVYGVGGNWGHQVTQGCYFHDLERGISTTAGNTQSATPDHDVLVDNCDFDMMFRTAVFVQENSSKKAPRLSRRAFCKTTRCFGRTGEPDNPHADELAFYGVAGYAADWVNIYDIGNTTVNTGSRAAYFASQFQTNSAYKQEICRIGNLFADYLNVGTTSSVSAGQNGFFYGNIMGRAAPEAGAAGTYYTNNINDSGKYGTVKRRNIAESGGGYADADGNYFLAKTNASYSAIFDGSFPLSTPTFSSVSDRSAVISGAVAAFNPKSTGAMSAISGLVDRSGNRLSLEKIQDYVKFTGLIDQAQSAAVVPTDWRKYWGLSDGQISVSGGEYSIADDSAGTNATAYTSAAGTITSGKWVKARVTTAGAAATSATATVTINGSGSAFTALTSPAQTYTAVDNGWTGSNNGGRLYNTSVASPTFVKGLFAFRIKKDSSVSGGIVFGDSTSGSTSFRAFMAGTTDTLRIYVAGGTNTIMDVANAVNTTSMSTVLVAVDLSPGKRDAAADAVRVSVNNSMKTLTGVTWNGPYPTQVSLASNSFGVLDRGSATASATMDADIEFFWADWGDENYNLPDIADPTVFAKFYKDLIGANGEGVTGSQPKIFFTGDATYWNGPTVTNLGTGGNYTKGGANSFV